MQPEELQYDLKVEVFMVLLEMDKDRLYITVFKGDNEDGTEKIRKLMISGVQ